MVLSADQHRQRHWNIIFEDNLQRSASKCPMLVVKEERAKGKADEEGQPGRKMQIDGGGGMYMTG